MTDTSDTTTSAADAAGPGPTPSDVAPSASTPDAAAPPADPSGTPPPAAPSTVPPSAIPTAPSPAVAPADQPPAVTTPTPPTVVPSAADVRVADLEAQLANLKAQLEAAGEPPAAVENPPKVGDLVTFTYDDPLIGTTSQYGIVRELETDEAGKPNRARVLWFSGLSGPLDLATLERQESPS